ncbi:oxidoreductase [Lithospermum erythrorhizon]|uniref:Oxidoreductase n=1 Tax=Lithospermum erythrorhizon TaxID=34254 RepID=A0AAV3QZ22_LITER
MTFDGIDADGTVTKGGYSSYIVVHERMMKHKINHPGKSLGVKKDEALDLLGADKFIISSDEQQMTELARSFDFIINTASGSISFDLYLSLLKANGVLVVAGVPKEVQFRTKTVTGALPGGVKHTQELLDFCGAHKIYPDIEMIPIQMSSIDIANSLK